MSIPAPARRHALGLPRGSVRTTHLVVVSFILSLLLLVSDHNGQMMPLPPYLVYLFFLMLGHFFGTRIGHPAHPEEKVFLGGLARWLIIAVLAATVGYRLYDDPEGLKTQLIATLDQMKGHPFLPLWILAAFITGAIFHGVVGRDHPPEWVQDVEAWLSLLAVVGLGIALLLHLVIIP